MKVSDTGEEMTAELRNGILVIHQGIAEDADVIVTMNLTELNATSRPGGSIASGSVQRNANTVKRLDSLLDRDVGGFNIHVR